MLGAPKGASVLLPFNLSVVMELDGFPRAARLVHSKEFDALRETSSRLYSRCFHLQYRFTSFESARLGMAVSRRVSKRAVVRNAIKRQIRESFRLQRRTLPSIDALVIARGIASETSQKVLRQDLTLLWSKLAALHRFNSATVT